MTQTGPLLTTIKFQNMLEDFITLFLHVLGVFGYTQTYFLKSLPSIRIKLN